jgi:hypothetical protein
VFWSSPEECAQKCQRLLSDPEFRNHLALQGRRRSLRNRTTNEGVLAQIFEAVSELGLAVDVPALTKIAGRSGICAQVS